MTHQKISKSLKALQYDAPVDQRLHTIICQPLREWNRRNEFCDGGDLGCILRSRKEYENFICDRYFIERRRGSDHSNTRKCSRRELW
jgi:hypothetical protein